MPRAEPVVSGVLLVGGSSRRFGSPKALASLAGITLAERGWALLGEVCSERIAVGKDADGLELPIPIVDDCASIHASLAGIVAGLHAATHDLVVMLPVDCPLLRADDLRALTEGCRRDVAVSQRGPLPGVYRKSSAPVLERYLARGQLRLRESLADLETDVVWIDPRHLVNVNSVADLRRAERDLTAAI